jgi:hypothetical protein
MNKRVLRARNVERVSTDVAAARRFGRALDGQTPYERLLAKTRVEASPA